MKAQLKYADRRGSPCVVIQGSDERARGEVQIKDLIDGRAPAKDIAIQQEWKAARVGAGLVPEAAARRGGARHSRAARGGQMTRKSV